MSDDEPVPGDTPSRPPVQTAPEDGPGTASGVHASAKLSPKTDDDDVEAIRTEATHRKWFALALAIVGTCAVGCSLWNAGKRIDAFVAMDIRDDLHARLAEIGMVGHAVISVAAMYFAYEMLRAAERLLIPRRLYGEAKDADVIQALTGVRAPSRFIARQVKAMLAEVSAVVKTAAHVTNAPRTPGERSDDADR